MEPEKISRNDARSGETPGIARYVLAISLILVVIGFTVAFLYYR